MWNYTWRWLHLFKLAPFCLDTLVCVYIDSNPAKLILDNVLHEVRTFQRSKVTQKSLV